MLISKFITEDMQDSVVSFEKNHGIQLPSDYRLFIYKYNGGETIKTNWPGKEKSDVRGFYGINLKDSNWDLVTNLKYEIPERLLEEGYLIFANNSFGDYFCIKLDDESIWFVYHDKSSRTQIANELTEFIGKCKSEPIGHIRTIEERKEMLIANGKGHKIDEKKVALWQKEIDRYANIHQEIIEL